MVSAIVRTMVSTIVRTMVKTMVLDRSRRSNLSELFWTNRRWKAVKCRRFAHYVWMVDLIGL
jgi:hypothetical protein